MFDEATILQRVSRVVSHQLNVEAEKVTPEVSFSEDLHADSLDLVELVMAFEKEFESELESAGYKDGAIPDEEAEKLIQVQDVVDFILAKAKSSGS